MGFTAQIGGIVLSLVVSGVIAWVGSSSSSVVAGLPLFFICVLLAFALQWLFFVHSWLKRSEKLFDLIGSITFVTVSLVALVLMGNYDLRSLLITLAIVVWALRLGPFLHSRIVKAGEDRRFREIKQEFTFLLMTWTMQGNWVVATAGCGIAALVSGAVVPVDGLFFAGFLLWVAGFAIEVIADNQKTRFKADPANDGRFIASGLWAWSRHPNYFGEIVLWVGVAVMAYPALVGNQIFTLVSPLIVIAQLTLISGVPMLERRADKLWGEDEDYRVYKQKTPTLMLWPPR